MTANCAYTMRTYTSFGGRTRYSASCTACDVACTGWTKDGAIAAFDDHRIIPAPPADVLARPLSAEIVAAYPAYFISGPGRQIASRTDCGHGYYLTDSCPCCP